MDEKSILNELKNLILTKSGIRCITPSDCKRISIEISKALNKNVSETTIKRLFGFADAKHRFSQFTLTTLSEYVDSVYISEMIPKERSYRSTGNEDWNDVRLRSNKTTQATLKGIKNRSGLPYQMTISRKFAEHDFEDFYESNYSFMSFISQPGYGKTILLSHLVEKYFYSENAKYKNSTVLFVKAYNLFTKDNTYFDMEERIKVQLGIPLRKDLITYINEQQNLTDNKFIIILDGFSDLVLKKGPRNQLFDNIINFICMLDETNAVKVIMSMRPTTWTRFFDRMRHSTYLKSAWFQGNYFNANEVSNVPPLTEKEIDQILTNISHQEISKIQPNLKSQLKFPFHIQLYYMLKEEDPTFNYFANITFYELISRFIQEKIYLSNYYTEKILTFKKFVELTDYGKNGNFVAKDLLIAELSSFNNSYTELLSEGILMEEKRYESSHPKEFVYFVHSNIFEYFLFIELLEKFNLNIDEKFFEYIENEYYNNQVYYTLLQWVIRHLIKNGNFEILKTIFKLKLKNFEKNYLMLFIAENIKYKCQSDPKTIDLLKKDKFHETLIKNLMNLDFADPCYAQAISIFLEIADTEENSLVYHAILAIIDTLSMDQNKLLIRINHMKKYQTISAGWLFDPLETAKLIYNKLHTNESEGYHELLQKTDNFIHGQNALTYKTELAPSLIISYVNMLALNHYYGTQDKTISIISSISKLHPRLLHNKSPFSIYLLTVLGLAGSRVQPGKKTDQLEHIIYKLITDIERYLITKHVELLFSMIKAEQSKNKQQYHQAIKIASECISLYKRNELILNCLMAYHIIIAAYQKLNDIVKTNEYKYERLCLLNEKNIRKDLFALQI